MFFKKQRTNYFILVGLLVAAVLIWSAVFSQAPDDILEVHFFDVGQGDSIFIETPQGQQVLIDGGPDKSVLEKLGQVMPFYDRSIDLVILTHPDADHITGLVSVLNYYQVDHILFSGFEKDTIVYQKWQDLIEEKHIPLSIVQAGQRIVLQKDIIMNIFWPEQGTIPKKANNASVVGQLVYNQTEFLLTGDIEKNIEANLLKWDLESDVLKVPHHGSKTSSSYNFLKAVNPQISVISVGENNRYKHPNQEVLDRLKNSAIYRTDQHGDIKIFTNGILFKVETEQ